MAALGQNVGAEKVQGLWGPGALWDPNANSTGQEAAYHPEVAPDVRLRALHYGRECANGYLELLDHVLLVRKAAAVCSSYQPPCVRSSPHVLHTQLSSRLFTSPPRPTFYFPNLFSCPSLPSTGAPSF